MPIPIQKLNEAIRPLDERIVEFLQRNSGQAYNLFELYATLEGFDAQGLRMKYFLDPQNGAIRARVGSYVQTLIALCRDGKVVEAQHQGETYYGLAGGR